MKNIGKTIYMIISALILLVILLSAFFITNARTNGFTTDFKTFSVSLNGKSNYGTTDLGRLQGGEYKFNVDYVLGGIFENDIGYSVKILPNVNINTDFEYSVDGKKLKFSELQNLNAAFDITASAKSFKLKIADKMNISSALQKIYVGATIQTINAKPFGKMIKLIVTPSNGADEVIFMFDLYGAKVESVTILPGGIII